MVQEVEIAYKCIILSFDNENKLYSFHKNINWSNFALGIMNMYYLHHFYGLRYNSPAGITTIINCEDDMKHLSRFNPTGHFDILIKDPRVDIRRDPWNNCRSNGGFRPSPGTLFGSSNTTGFGSSNTEFGQSSSTTGFGLASAAGPTFGSSSNTGFGQSSSNIEVNQISDYENITNNPVGGLNLIGTKSSIKNSQIIATTAGFSRINKAENIESSTTKETLIQPTTKVNEEDNLINKTEIQPKTLDAIHEKEFNEKQDKLQLTQETNDSEYITVDDNEAKNNVVLDKLKLANKATDLLLKNRGTMKTTTAFEAILQVISDQIQSGVHIDINELEKSLRQF